MSLITLTTEWNASDYYQGKLKGLISTLCPDVRIIDNAHSLTPFNLQHAAFVVRNTFSSYPTGTIHIICVHTDPGKESSIIIAKARDHFFIGSDNGLFSLILNAPPERMAFVKVEEGTDEILKFAEIASQLANGKEIDEIGEITDKYVEKMPLRATIDSSVISGSVIFIDSYGNAITNITRDIFQRVFGDKKFQILVQYNKHRIDRISPSYSSEPVGDLIAHFNSLDLLEIAINGGNIAQLFDLSAGSSIRIEGVKQTNSKDKLF